MPCFTAGTWIETDRGGVPVENLRPGDRVRTKDHGFQPLVWTCQTRVRAEALAANDKLKPIRILPGALGNRAALLVSRQHCVLMDACHGLPGEHLVRACHLARTSLAERVDDPGPVTYVHLLCQRHEIIFADGIATETFYPGPVGLDRLDPAAMQRLKDCFPLAGLAPPEAVFGPRIRPVADMRMLRRGLKSAGLWQRPDARVSEPI